MKIQVMCAPHRLCAVGLVAFVIVLVVCSISSCQRSQFSGGLTKLKPCRLPGIKEELLCGKLTVFEDRETRTGRTIDLNIVVFPAFDQKNKGEPLFEIEGGPGAAASNAAMFYAKEGKEYRRKHDVVLVDQRGTGKSNPLIAPPIKKAPQDYLKEMYPVDHVKNLRRTLEQRADLTEYTTPIAMDDLDDVRSWLGYERINLFGLSYGTRAVLAYMRQHPEHVHTATLMGVAPTYLKMPFYHSQAAARAMDLLLQECETDPGCHNAFPQIRVDWQGVLAQLGREPARIQYSPDNKSASGTVEIQRDIFTEKIRNWMYGADKARKIPFIIHQAARGDFVPFLKEAIAPGIPDFIADGMYLSSHVCGRCAVHRSGGSGEVERRKSFRELSRVSTNARVQFMAARKNSGRLSRAGFIESPGADFLRQSGSGDTTPTRGGSREIFTKQPPRPHPGSRPWHGWIERRRLC